MVTWKMVVGAVLAILLFFVVVNYFTGAIDLGVGKLFGVTDVDPLALVE